ncbi:protein translocase subunit SecD [Dyella flagellata]|uniref:Protein translocase subunit SecD n=1 Tax=Dyella flagellata TaxID=1867833 RepID=A0ABQ5XEE4_9GAMM|nr:protein translocase subunit SecD [Dyella flagellata]GLQ89667.1 protein translocase subunit SecD [Dyella flagellata]
MSDFPRWKYFLVAVVLVLGILYALPNAYPPLQAVQVTPAQGTSLDPTVQQKVISALQAAKLSYVDESLKHDPNRGDYIVVGFANGDLQKSAADALKAALGENYNVGFNLESTVPRWLGVIGGRAMPLGLDLQGGVRFLMAVDQNDIIDRQENRYTQDITALLKDKKISFISVTRNATRGQGVIVVTGSQADRTAASDAIATEYTDLAVTDGQSTGDRFVLNAVIKPNKLHDLQVSAIRQNLTTLGNRINALGVSEPVIQAQGEDHISVELAGVQDPAEAKKVIGATATLQYVAGLGEARFNGRDWMGDQTVADAVHSGNIPPDAHLYYNAENTIAYLVSKNIIASGDELADASSGTDQQTGSPSVNVTLNSVGASKMLDFTRENVGKPMAVVYVENTTDTKIVDGKEVRTPKTTYQVINYATINGVFSNKFQTTGLGSPKAASDLVTMLKGGSLAARMDIVSEGVIGPSLGQDNIDKGLKAVLLGLGLVLLAAAIYYKLFGLVADIALFFNLVVLVAVMSMIGVTLTMPGIAGIVLTLGMAIDANVLICERVREELRNGSTPLAAIRAGYEKAWATILDANVTHLIAALALTTMGSGPIKGFGVTLLIGILTSMFTSVTVTHAITALIHGGRKLKTLSV